MCYNSIINTQTTNNCFVCNSDLLLISHITEKLDGSRFPQTTSTYSCTNSECQKEKDRQAEKRLKLIKDKAISDNIRTELKLRNKKILEKNAIKEGLRQ